MRREEPFANTWRPTGIHASDKRSLGTFATYIPEPQCYLRHRWDHVLIQHHCIRPATRSFQRWRTSCYGLAQSTPQGCPTIVFIIFRQTTSIWFRSAGVQTQKWPEVSLLHQNIKVGPWFVHFCHIRFVGFRTKAREFAYKWSFTCTASCDHPTIPNPVLNSKFCPGHIVRK